MVWLKCVERLLCLTCYQITQKKPTTKSYSNPHRRSSTASDGAIKNRVFWFYSEPRLWIYLNGRADGVLRLEKGMEHIVGDWESEAESETMSENVGKMLEFKSGV